MPRPLETDRDFERFHHRDLPSVRDLWAERYLLTQRLAWTQFHRQSGRVLFASDDGAPVSELDWIPERLGQLDAEAKRRKAGGAAHV